MAFISRATVFAAALALALPVAPAVQARNFRSSDVHPADYPTVEAVKQFGKLLAGAVLTEQIFTIPGFGKLVVDAVFNRDYPVVQGVVLATALIFVTLSLIADLLYMAINPRMRQA